MKRISAILALMCITLSTQAVQTIELKEYPKLKPLNWCKNSDGVSRGQIDPCGPDTTVGTSISQSKSKKYVTDNSATPDQNAAAVNNKEIMRQGQKAWLKLLGFAFICGLVAKFTGRSFLRWSFVGIILHIILVSLNLLSF